WRSERERSEREKRERESSVSPTSGGASARVPASVAHLFPVKSRISAEGLGSYGSPYGGEAAFSGSMLFRLLISHLKRLVNVGGVGSMVDGSHVTVQIVFDDTDEIAMGLMLSDERSHAT
ncbi:hypothetical protein HID58_045328, partial [Brassica napus]